MKKKIIALIALSLLMTERAWAGGGAPELPAEFAPIILLGLSGVVLGLRFLIKK